VNWQCGAEGKTNISLRYRKVDTSKYVLDFENEDEFDLLDKWDKDEDGYNWCYEVWESSHSGTGMVVSYFYIDGQNLEHTDNLFFLPTMDVTGKELKFWASSYSSNYPDGLGVFFLPDGKEMDTQNMEPLLKWTAVPEGWTEYPDRRDRSREVDCDRVGQRGALHRFSEGTCPGRRKERHSGADL
jgi:hypothetical protein